MNNKNRLIHVLGGLALVGGVMAVFLIIAFEQKGWGRPGSFAYQTDEMLNRRMAAALRTFRDKRTKGYFAGMWRR